jgi:hypothetical protein
MSVDETRIIIMEEGLLPKHMDVETCLCGNLLE